MRAKLIALLMLFGVINCALANDALPDLKIRKLDEGVYLHSSYQVVDGFGLVDSNGLVVLDGNDAYIIDTPWSAEDTQKLLDWLKAQGIVVKGGISTHFHEDRTAGIELLNAQAIPTYASVLTNELLAKAGQAQARNMFDLAGFEWVKGKVEVFYPGAGHSRDNVVVWLPEKEILVGGCFVRAKETGSLGNVSDAVISDWPKSAEKLMSRYQNARLVIPGHGKIGDVSLLEHTQALAATENARLSTEPAARAE